MSKEKVKNTGEVFPIVCDWHGTQIILNSENFKYFPHTDKLSASVFPVQGWDTWLCPGCIGPYICQMYSCMLFCLQAIQQTMHPVLFLAPVSLNCAMNVNDGPSVPAIQYIRMDLLVRKASASTRLTHWGQWLKTREHSVQVYLFKLISPRCYRKLLGIFVCLLPSGSSLSSPSMSPCPQHLSMKSMPK